MLVDDDADLDFAVNRIRTGAFAYAGQVCISVQRVFIHEKVYDTVRDRIVEASAKLRMGDPADPATELGPMIDDKAAARTQAWIEDAVKEGATVLTGTFSDNSFLYRVVKEPKASFDVAQLRATAGQ